MTLIKKARVWEIPEREATSEDTYLNRRRFLRNLGFQGAGAAFAVAGLSQWACQSQDGVQAAQSKSATPSPTASLYPAPRNEAFTLDRPLTDEQVAARYNNFYEFSTDKQEVAELAERLETRPWEIKISGHVNNPLKLDLDDLVRKMPLEERLYRHRCVEAWAMAVPWTGFPMKELIRMADPKPNVKYVRMVSFLRPEQAPGQRRSSFPWPYYEGLTMAEAMNDLTLLVTGIYGHELTKSHGAPIRLVTPWKYGFKSIKSIVLVQFTDRRPTTFWNTLSPREYDFQANVDPNVPHPRWSQEFERMLGTDERRRTLIYNGYEEHVAALYRGESPGKKRS